MTLESCRARSATVPIGSKPLLAILSVATLLVALSSCDQEGSLLGPDVHSIELDSSSGTLTVGEVMQFSAIAYGAEGAALPEVRPLWVSEDTGVATVTSQGQVTAVSPGTTRIAAAAGGRSAIATLTVVAEVQLEPVGITTPAQLPAGRVGEYYEIALVAHGGQPPYLWSIQSGGLPVGLSFSGVDGTISGTPMNAGTSEAVVRLEDDAGSELSRTFSVTVEPAPEAPSVGTTSLPGAVVGESYSAMLNATGGEMPYSWLVSQGALPPGLDLDSSSGGISGTPSSHGAWDFLVRVTGDDGLWSERSLSIAVSPAPEAPAITISSLPEGNEGAAYSARLEATGGQTPYLWSISAGSLPVGLSLDSASGGISGTPASPGVWQFTVRVTGDDGLWSAESLSISVQAAPEAPTITTSALPDGTVGESYSAALEAVGGQAPYLWSISTGSLPEGLSLDSSSGVISGTPEHAGVHDLTIRVAGSDGLDSVRQLGLTVDQSAGRTLWAEVAAGRSDTCGITVSGDVYCWGSSLLPTSTYVPTRIEGVSAVVQVSVGRDFACARTQAGGAYCWGSGSVGQLGDGNDESSFVARRVTGLSSVTHISAGGRHACAVESDGTIHCWGSGESGQLGYGGLEDRSSPQIVADVGVAFASVEIGPGQEARHTCALTVDGRAYCWGAGSLGRIGNGSTQQRPTPTPVSGAITFSTLTVGDEHACGVAAAGLTFCWGAGRWGRLGTGSESDQLTPALVSTELTFETMSAGARHTCALEPDGNLVCWGAHSNGALGNSWPSPRLTPTSAGSDIDFSHIGSGTAHACGRSTDSRVYCWGIADAQSGLPNDHPEVWSNTFRIPVEITDPYSWP